MFNRKAVTMAVAGLLASSGFAMADTTPIQTPKLTLDPTVVTADAAPQGLLMQAMDKAGMGKTLADTGINVYGWVEGGYTYNHRHGSDNTIIAPGPFNHEYGNHFMLNQTVLRFEKQVDASKGKFDVGGLVEVMYGSDAARIHSTGLGYDGSDPTDNEEPSDILATTNVHPIWQFDIPQAYIDVALPVGSGLTLRVGKFTTLLSTETIDPRGNAFYSHSWSFNALPFTHTGVLGIYNVNEQLKITAGVTRGWDIALEDNNGCAIDTIGQISYALNKQTTIALNWSVGPENSNDSSHYRTAINPIMTWQATDKLKLGLEGLYVYDGGANGDAPSNSHAYGDVWGATLYAGYTVNDYVTVNGRFEKFHSYSDSAGNVGAGDSLSTVLGFNGVPTVNIYSATLGLTIKPMPKDPIGQNLSVRPEIRYDFSEDRLFPANGSAFKDQLTFGADFIFTF